MFSIPDFLYSATVYLDRYVIQEANVFDIPIAGLTDSNSSKDGVTYVIPGNDEAVESIFFVLKFLLRNLHIGFFMRITLFFFKIFSSYEKAYENNTQRCFDFS
jgi:ribosomal protein S2